MAYQNKLKQIAIVVFSLALILSVKKTEAYTSLEPYCHDGYYKLPNEPVCSRSPGCGGYTYAELNTSDKMPDPQLCEGENGGVGRGCNGWVPLCCYEMVRTGDFTKCIGYWERLWCAPSQCQEAERNGASDSQCGGSCQCSHAFKTYCGDVPPIPLDVRLRGELEYGQPYNPTTPTLPPPTSTPTQKPTPTTIPTTQSTSNPPFSSPTPTSINNIPTSYPINTPTSPPTQYTPKPTSPSQNPPSYFPTSSTQNNYPTNPPSNYKPAKYLMGNIKLPSLNLKNIFHLPKINIKISVNNPVKKILNPTKVKKADENLSRALNTPVKGVKKVQEVDKKLANFMNSFIKNILEKLLPKITNKQ